MRIFDGYFYDLNGDLYYSSLYAPEWVDFAHSRSVPFVVNYIKDNDMAPEDGGEVTLQLTDAVSGLTYTETKILDANGSTTFRTERFMQMFLDGTLADDTCYDYTAASKLITSLRIDFALIYKGVSAATGSMEIRSGMIDIMERYNSTKPHLRYFEGLPFTFDFPNYKYAKVTRDGVSTSVSNMPAIGGGTPSSRIRVNMSQIWTLGTRQYVVETRDGDGHLRGVYWSIAKSTDTGHVAGSMLVVNDPVGVVITADPCNKGVYLRYIGRHGEMFYWLFQPQQQGVSYGVDTYRRADIPIDRAVDGVVQDDTFAHYDKERTLKVYSQPLDGYEYKVVMQLFDAPYVDMLVEGDEAHPTDIIWRRVRIAKGSYSERLKHTDDNTLNREVAFTIELPKEATL